MNQFKKFDIEKDEYMVALVQHHVSTQAYIGPDQFILKKSKYSTEV